MRSPVVLVHGFLATQALMTPLRRRLEHAGHPVALVDLSPLVIQDVRRLATQLDRAVDAARARFGVERIDVVGVSQGGVIALWWAHHCDGWPRVDRLISIGAPVRGTWAALVGLPALGLVSRGIWQLLPGSRLIRELDRPLPPAARVTTLALRSDPVCPPARCRIDGAAHHVLPAPLGPLSHQWLVFSGPVARALEDVLTADG